MKKYKVGVAEFVERNRELVKRALTEPEKDRGLSATQLEVARLAMVEVKYSPKTALGTIYQAVIASYVTR